jgi:TRAP-type transport system periplasmic protein
MIFCERITFCKTKKGGIFCERFFKEKEVFTISLVIILMGALIVAGCGGQPAPAPSTPSAPSTPAPDTGQTFEFSLAHMWPGGHPHEVDFAQKWGADLEKASNGRIKIVSYPGGTLLSGPETYEGVVQGVAD